MCKGCQKKLLPKDKIIGVAQSDEKPIPVIDMDLRDVVKMIRGKKGTKVRLTILRESPTKETFEVTLVRDKIDLKDHAAKISFRMQKRGDKTLKVGVLDLRSFYGGDERGGSGRTSSRDVRKCLEEAKNGHADAVVMDLSLNGGGLLDEAIRISGLFIKTGNVVATKETSGHVQIQSDDDESIAYSGPLVVLTSRNSASASEILAGVLKDYHRAIVVGADHTFGKGTVQAVKTLPNLGSLVVTTGMFFTAGGKSTQRIGVPADVKIPSLLNLPDIGEESLDYALPNQSIPKFTSTTANSREKEEHWIPVTRDVLAAVTKKSAERINKSAKFKTIRKELNDIKKEKGVVKLEDLMKKKPTDPTNLLDPQNSNPEKKKDDDPVLDEAVEIAGDLAQVEGTSQAR